MKERGEYTFNEITTQSEAWASALARFRQQEPQIKAGWSEIRPKRIVATGCGSTYYLAQTAAYLLQSATGIPASGLPASEIALSPDKTLVDPESTLLLAISRSGTTSETMHAVEQFRRRGGAAVWAISCYPESPLARVANLALSEPLAQEQSVAQTRSFATMLVQVQALAASLSGKAIDELLTLPVRVKQLLADSAELMQTIGARTDFKRLYFLGSGPLFGIANEAMLKMTETSLTHAQGFHFMEYRHGPMSMANEDALVIGLVSADRTRHDLKVLAEMRQLGATTLALTPHAEKVDSDWQLAIPALATLPSYAHPALYLPPLQLLAYHRSMSKSLDPDNPRNLEAVVYLDSAEFA